MAGYDLSCSFFYRLVCKFRNSSFLLSMCDVISVHLRPIRHSSSSCLADLPHFFIHLFIAFLVSQIFILRLKAEGESCFVSTNICFLSFIYFVSRSLCGTTVEPSECLVTYARRKYAGSLCVSIARNFIKMTCSENERGILISGTS